MIPSILDQFSIPLCNEKRNVCYGKTSFKTMWQKATCDLKDMIDCGFCYPPFSIVMKMLLARHSLFYSFRPKFVLGLSNYSTRWSSRGQNSFFIKGKNLGLVKTNKLGQLCQSILNIEINRKVKIRRKYNFGRQGKPFQLKVYQNQSPLIRFLFYRREKCFIEGNKKKGYVATLLKEKNRNSRSNV